MHPLGQQLIPISPIVAKPASCITCTSQQTKAAPYPVRAPSPTHLRWSQVEYLSKPAHSTARKRDSTRVTASQPMAQSSEKHESNRNDSTHMTAKPAHSTAKTRKHSHTTAFLTAFLKHSQSHIQALTHGHLHSKSHSHSHSNSQKHSHSSLHISSHSKTHSHSTAFH